MVPYKFVFLQIVGAKRNYCFREQRNESALLGGVSITPGDGEESTVVTARSLSKVTTLFQKSNCALNSRKNLNQQSPKIYDSMRR